MKLTLNQHIGLWSFALTILWIGFNPDKFHEVVHGHDTNPAWMQCANDCEQGIYGRIKMCTDYCSTQFNP